MISFSMAAILITLPCEYTAEENSGDRRRNDNLPCSDCYLQLPPSVYLPRVRLVIDRHFFAAAATSSAMMLMCMRMLVDSMCIVCAGIMKIELKMSEELSKKSVPTGSGTGYTMRTVLGGAATSALDIGESVMDTTILVYECFDDLRKQSGVCFGEHCVLEKQLGVKFGVVVDRFIGALNFVLGSALVNVDSLEDLKTMVYGVKFKDCLDLIHLTLV
ncbi:hypothetical protein RHSIM_RhsimUnG0191400 [Rhododendron simsii]|uniref:Uncharacterized protein n=1 Tax=Rhododendron simsii TaxID=118357 RepID=A0A834L285_RHOSS|nr:hypothetical protein RHSIM_RhsimUnG0191400 [Rhododendron simsii]